MHLSLRDHQKAPSDSVEERVILTVRINHSRRLLITHWRPYCHKGHGDGLQPVKCVEDAFIQSTMFAQPGDNQQPPKLRLPWLLPPHQNGWMDRWRNMLALAWINCKLALFPTYPLLLKIFTNRNPEKVKERAWRWNNQNESIPFLELFISENPRDEIISVKWGLTIS